jgi:hypothetical protein
LGLNTIGVSEGNSWSPSIDQPNIQIAEDSLSVGPTKSETEAVKVWVTYLLLVEPAPCPISLKKRRTAACHLLQRDKSSWLSFSNFSNTSNSFQLSIPPKTMSSGTVHAADFCITAQRLLAATKTHGKWEMR